MIPIDVAFEALSALCNANVTSAQKQGWCGATLEFDSAGGRGAAVLQLSIKNFIPTVLNADDTCGVSKRNLHRLQLAARNAPTPGDGKGENHVDIGALTDPKFIIKEDEFFDPRFDYDFTNLRDTETYYRGGEVYKRPYGWHRFALKVLDKYDGNTWLGTTRRSTESVPGEWPVSYHGTTESAAEGIIEGHYKAGKGQVYGRGIYSTPDLSEADHYAITFTSQKTGKKYEVVLQNRINPEYREKHNDDKYWLIRIPMGKAGEEEMMVERAIRPYGLLLKEV